MEKKLKSEKQDEDYYKLSNNKYNVSLTQITSLSSSYKIYLPFEKSDE